MFSRRTVARLTRNIILLAAGSAVVRVWILALPLALFVSLAGCQTSTANSISQRSATGPRCEADYERYAESRDFSRLSEVSKSMVGTTASYAVAGSIAITETLLYTTGGIAIGALVCSPIIAIEAASESNGHASIECVVRIGSYATIALAEDSEYSLTQGVWRATEGMRLESYDNLAAYLLDSVECRLERDAPGDRDQAARQLQSLRGDRGIWSRLSTFSIERAERLEGIAAR